MTIGQSLIALRRERNMTQADVARLAKIAQGQISDYEADKVKPRIDALGKLAQVFRVSVAAIDESLRNVNGVSNVTTTAEEMLRVPVFGMAAAAEMSNSNMPLADYAAQNADEYVYFPDAKKGDFSLVASGNSMSPWYPNGTRLLVRPTVRPHDGERVIAVLGDGDVVFKVFVEGKETFALCSIAASGKNFVFDKMQIGAVRALYSVVASYRVEADLDAAMSEAGIRHYWEKIKEELK